MHPKRQPYTTKQIISSDTVPTILYKFTLWNSADIKEVGLHAVQSIFKDGIISFYYDNVKTCFPN